MKKVLIVHLPSDSAILLLEMYHPEIQDVVKDLVAAKKLIAIFFIIRKIQVFSRLNNEGFLLINYGTSHISE